jgi:glyoxylase-like metal-dependent hydrolase (beta-lactamase superfamily II)
MGSWVLLAALAVSTQAWAWGSQGHQVVAAMAWELLQPATRQELNRVLALEPGETVSHILVTHHHSDHSPLAAPLKARTGAPIYGCAVAQQAAASSVITEAGHDLDFTPDIDLCGGGMVLSGPGWTLEAIATPGHTSNHICFALKEENALFSGDHIMGWSTTVISPPDGDMGDYFASLDRIKARNFATLWPTHGPAITEPGPFVQAYIDHRRNREAQILAAISQGLTRIKAMVPVLYKDVDPRLHPAAAHSVLAHTLHLVREGRLSADGAPGLDSEYSLKG